MRWDGLVHLRHSSMAHTSSAHATIAWGWSSERALARRRVVLNSMSTNSVGESRRFAHPNAHFASHAVMLTTSERGTSVCR